MNPIRILLFFLVLITSIKSNGQDIGTTYQYYDLDVDLQRDYNGANFIVDFCYTEGFSLGDRYFYEIVITDTVMTLIFEAPESGSFHYLKYVKRILLDSEVLDTLKMILGKANLKQKHQGIADWQGSMYTRQILVVNYESIHIAGGQTFMPSGAYSEDEPEAVAEEKILKDKVESSSISGDYDSIINYLKKYFTNIGDLYNQTKKDY